MDLDGLVIGTDASALREDEHVLAALERMLRRPQRRHVGFAALDGNAAREREGPSGDADLVELGLEDGANAVPARPQIRHERDDLGHGGVIADDDGTGGALDSLGEL